MTLPMDESGQHAGATGGERGPHMPHVSVEDSHKSGVDIAACFAVKNDILEGDLIRATIHTNKRRVTVHIQSEDNGCKFTKAPMVTVEYDPDYAARLHILKEDKLRRSVVKEIAAFCISATEFKAKAAV